MKTKTKTTHLLIHVFAVAHALTALLLYSTALGDELLLTIFTIVMIIAIARLWGSPLEVAAALALLGCFAGFYLGTKGATLVADWAPVLNGYVNVCVTFAVTETLGWATYIVVKPKRKMIR